MAKLAPKRLRNIGGASARDGSSFFAEFAVAPPLPLPHGLPHKFNQGVGLLVGEIQGNSPFSNELPVFVSPQAR